MIEARRVGATWLQLRTTCRSRALAEHGARFLPTGRGCGRGRTLIEILVSLPPLFVIGYAGVDWLRGNNALNVFQVIVMVQATLATLIDVVIFAWFSFRLDRLSVQAIGTHMG
jgi:hypothetical protein